MQYDAKILRFRCNNGLWFALLSGMNNKRILILDDEPIILNLLSLLLRYEGAEIDAVNSCTAAQQLLTTRVYDAVVADIRLPDGSGTELLAQGYANAPAQRWVMITAYDDPATRARCKELGCSAFFSKPFHLGAVRQAVLAILNGEHVKPAKEAV